MVLKQSSANRKNKNGKVTVMRNVNVVSVASKIN